MNKILSLITVSIALLSVSSNASAYDLLICTQTKDQDQHEVVCKENAKAGYTTYNLYNLSRSGWKIIAIVPALIRTNGTHEVLQSKTFYLQK